MPDPNNVLVRSKRGGRMVAFMCITKAGNTSIKFALATALRLERPPGKKIETWVHNQKTFDTVGREYLAARRSSIRIFAFVRNPFERLERCWRDKVAHAKKFKDGGVGVNSTIRPSMSFPDFVRAVAVTRDASCDQHIRSQAYELISDGFLVPHFIGRVESMADDWANVQTMLAEDFRLPALTHKNKSPSRLKASWNDDLRALVVERYMNDFRIFGYSPELRTD